MKFLNFLFIFFIVSCSNNDIKSKVSKQAIANINEQIEQQVDSFEKRTKVDDTVAENKQDFELVKDTKTTIIKETAINHLEVAPIKNYLEDSLIEIKKIVSDSFSFDDHILSTQNIYVIFTGKNIFHLIFNGKVYGVNRIIVNNVAGQAIAEPFFAILDFDDFFEIYKKSDYKIFDFGKRENNYFEKLHLFWLNVCEGKHYNESITNRSEAIHSLEKISDFKISLFVYNDSGKREYFRHRYIYDNFEDIFTELFLKIFVGKF